MIKTCRWLTQQMYFNQFSCFIVQLRSVSCFLQNKWMNEWIVHCRADRFSTAEHSASFVFYLPQPRRLCFHLCLFVPLCLLWIKFLMKFCGMVGHNPGINRLNRCHFEWPWPKFKVTRDQKVQTFFAITVQNCGRMSRQKLKRRLFNFLNISEYDYDVGLTIWNTGRG